MPNVRNISVDTGLRISALAVGINFLLAIERTLTSVHRKQLPAEPRRTLQSIRPLNQ
jgi:hypothetical protein